MAVISLSPIVGIDGILTIKDGAALSLVAPFSNGDFKLPGLNAGLTSGRSAMQEVTDFFARGKYIGSRYTKGKVLEGSFTCHLTALIGETADPSILDALLRKNDWASPTSTIPASRGDVPHYTLEWAVERTDFGATNDRKLTLKYCEVTGDISEGDDGSTLTINFRAKPYSTDSVAFT